MAGLVKQFEDKYIRMTIADGILYGEYKKDVYIDLPIAKNIVKERMELCNGVDYPTLGKIEGKITFAKDARDWLGKEGTTNMSKMAILVDSMVSKVVGNWFLTLSRPPIPTKLFTTEADALKWLKEVQ